MQSFSSTLFLFTILGLTKYQCLFNKSDNKQEPVNINFRFSLKIHFWL